MPIFRKTSKGEIGFIEDVPAETKPAYTLPEQVYTRAFLLKQLIDIQTQWDEQLAQKQKEILEINATQGREKTKIAMLLAEAVKLGITS